MNKKAFIPISALIGAFLLALVATMTLFVAEPDRAYAQTAIMNFDENGTGPVATFTAMDPEGVTPIYWSVPTDLTADDIDAIEDADDADNTHFDISKDGVLTFDIGDDSGDPDVSVSPDFEAPRGEAPSETNTNTYKVVVVASDAMTDGVMGYHKVTVEVTDVAEPGELEVTVGVAGNALQFRSTATLTATLMDGDISGPSKTIAAASNSLIVRWYRGSTLIDDNDNDLEYTVVAADVGSRIRAVATYRIGNNPNQETASWTSAYPVLADRVGDNELKFDPATLEMTVAEGEKGTNVGAPVRATGNHGAVVYSLPVATDDAIFDIDERSGQISFGQDLNREVVTGETNNCGDDYKCVVRVRATDATSATENAAAVNIFADATVNITLTDVNEKPVFVTDINGTPAAASPTSIMSPENRADLYDTETPADAVNVTYTATDPEGRSLTYRLMGSDGGKFELNALRVLSFKAEPDYEMPGDANRDNVYEVTVRASDGTMHADLMVMVMVTTADEAPEIMEDEGLRITGLSSRNYAENGTGAVATYVLSGANKDRAIWSLEGVDRGDFTIGRDGMLSFHSPPDYESPSDANRDNVYMVTVKASYGASMDTHDVVVTVTDEDDTTAPSDLFERYDTNGDMVLDKAEILKAINDYLFLEDGPTKAEVLELINIYLFGSN